MASLTAAKIVVVKIGSTLLVERETGHLRLSWLRSLAQDIAWLKKAGAQVVVVSSGSIALGQSVLKLPAQSLPLEQSQAAAAVGQIQLARAYEDSLKPHGVITAQVLVTLDDSQNRRRYLNCRATLSQLLSMGVVPIVNENDTVATDEIRYGDNDRLAAQIAAMVGADQLILLSDVDGFYSANPQTDRAAKRFEIIHAVTTQLEAMAGDAASGLSKGGMKTKLMAAKTAMNAGCAMAITLGAPQNPLMRLQNGGAATWFMPTQDVNAARKKWILTMKPKGALQVDAGAYAALSKGKSLLPAGVLAVKGDFERGDMVQIISDNSVVVACGLTRYSAIEAQKIMGRQTGAFEALLGYAGRSALVHRDDMVLEQSERTKANGTD